MLCEFSDNPQYRPLGVWNKMMLSAVEKVLPFEKHLLAYC